MVERPLCRDEKNPHKANQSRHFHFFTRQLLAVMLPHMSEINKSEVEDRLHNDLLLLHQIYPTLNRAELLEAKENLDRYFDLAIRIFLRLQKTQAIDMLDLSDQSPYDPSTSP